MHRLSGLDKMLLICAISVLILSRLDEERYAFVLMKSITKKLGMDFLVINFKIFLK